MLNVLNGTLDLGIGEIQEMVSQIEAGQVRLLATLTATGCPACQRCRRRRSRASTSSSPSSAGSPARRTCRPACSRPGTTASRRRSPILRTRRSTARGAGAGVDGARRSRRVHRELRRRRRPQLARARRHQVGAVRRDLVCAAAGLALAGAYYAAADAIPASLPPTASARPASRSRSPSRSRCFRSPNSAARTASDSPDGRGRPSRPSAPASAGHVASRDADSAAGGSEGHAQTAEVGHDRALEGEGSAAARQPAEQRRPPPELHPQVHDDPLALRVDGRVGDLGERLARWSATGRSSRARPGVGVSSPMLHSGSCASRAIVLMSSRRAPRRARRGSERRGRARAPPRRRGRRDRVVLVERARGVMDRELAKHPRLGVGVLEDGPPAGLDQKHLARTEPAATDRVGGGQRDRAGLGRDDDQPVAAHREGRRPQPVRSISAPTRLPSAKTIAAGPSHGASIPAVRRRSVATCGCGARRSASASGMAASNAGARAQPVAVSSSRPSSSDSESEPSGESSGPAAVSSPATVARRCRGSGRAPARDCPGPC